MSDLGLKDALSSVTWSALLEAAALLVVAALAIVVIQNLLPRLANRLGGKPRLYLLASVPLLRLVIILLAITLIVPTLIEPTFENMVAVFGALGIALGFAFKDYANSLIAGIVTLYEMPYRPGDWIKVDGHYGEVRAIGTRAAEIVTLDDDVVIIPHSKLWNESIANGNDGTDNLMCVTVFHLEPGHNPGDVITLLETVAWSSPLLQINKPVSVVASARPWGLEYRVKAYPLTPRDQARFITDITARGTEALQQNGCRLTSLPLAQVS